MTASCKTRRFPKSPGVQGAFWEIIASVEQSRVVPASQDHKRSAQDWLLRAAGPVEAIKNGGDSSGEKAEYALALFRLWRAEGLLRVIGSDRLAGRLDSFMTRLKKLRAARWGVV